MSSCRETMDVKKKKRVLDERHTESEKAPESNVCFGSDLAITIGIERRKERTHQCRNGPGFCISQYVAPTLIFASGSAKEACGRLAMGDVVLIRYIL